MHSKKKISFERKALSSADQLAASLGRVSLKDPNPISTFEQLGLKLKLLRGIFEYGLEKPAPCQEKVILPCIKGRDVIIQAQSGMGKTVGAAIPILQLVDPNIRQCQALVLSPTRELAEQTKAVFDAIGKYLQVETVRCVGGTPSKPNKSRLNNGAHIAIGTLGRVYSLMKQNFIKGDSIKLLLIDEADKMVTDRDFIRDLKYIIANVSATAQVTLMSATMPLPALERAETFLRNPYRALLKADQLTLEGIKQFYVNLTKIEEKVAALEDLFPLINKTSTIIFCNSRNMTEWLSKRMQSRGHPISDMVGTKDQSARSSTLKSFRSGAIRVLIASDLLGRGIDVHQVKLVINFDLPDLQQYIHRVGRAGRYGKQGIAINFIASDIEKMQLDKIQEYYGSSITEMPINIGQLLD